MNVYIPTYQRIEQQVTYDALDKVWDTVFLVCTAEEAEAHWALGRRCIVIPDEVEGNIARKRQWIVENCDTDEDAIMMADDDLRFFVRFGEDPALYPCNNEDLGSMLEQTEKELLYYPLVAISARQGNNNLKFPKVIASRVCTCWAVDREVLKRLNIRFDDVPLMEDFHVNLSLLEAGYETCVLSEYAWDQRISGDKGGCSEARAQGLQKIAAERLAELHSHCVKVVTRETKVAWGGGLRYDVQVGWKKALKYGAGES